MNYMWQYLKYIIDTGSTNTIIPKNDYLNIAHRNM